MSPAQYLLSQVSYFHHRIGPLTYKFLELGGDQCDGFVDVEAQASGKAFLSYKASLRDKDRS